MLYAKFGRNWPYCFRIEDENETCLCNDNNADDRQRTNDEKSSLESLVQVRRHYCRYISISIAICKHKDIEK